MMGEVEEEMSPRSARAKLADEIKVLQRKVPSLLVLRVESNSKNSGKNRLVDGRISRCWMICMI